MTEFNTDLPGVRQVQSYIKDKQEVELKLVTDDLVVGKIIWQDADALCLMDHYNQQTLVWRQALVYLKPKLSCSVRWVNKCPPNTLRRACF